MTVDILCKVVDNLGDIGFVYRLARALSELPDPPRLRLIVDDLASFAGICPGVTADESIQTVDGVLVVRWNNPGLEAINRFRSEPPTVVIECYACGRPDWFEAILFDEANPLQRLIVNLEYLTAEPWASEFHLLPSLTRSTLVRKVFFMPGFVRGTGGLLQDKSFTAIVEDCASTEKRLSVRRSLIQTVETGGLESRFWVLIFSYEHDFSHLVNDLAVFNAEKPIFVLVAAGRSSAPFLDAWKKAGSLFPVLPLPLLPQQKWDQFLVASDFAIVRGEETLSRASLAGRPFLWQCYPFADTGHLSKVYAFLELLKPYLNAADYDAYERLTLHFNGVHTDSLNREIPKECEEGEFLSVLRLMDSRSYGATGACSGRLAEGFSLFSKEIRELGNLAANLLTFIRKME